MAVKLKLTRLGSKKHPFYRVVAANDETRRDGHDAVERMLLAAQTGQFQLNSHDYLLFVLW